MSTINKSEFDFIEDSHTRSMVVNGYNAVTQLELWSWIKEFDPKEGGFMFSNDPNIYKIVGKMETLPNPPGHSGSSFALTMRHLEFIAKNGMDEYKKELSKKQLCFIVNCSYYLH